MSELLAHPPFPGLRDEAFDFLRALAANNRRDWFKPRKAMYEDELKGPLECLIADVARRMAEANLPLTGDPKRSRFRIYRDTRFSNDKRPYKTNLGAVFDRSGRKDKPGMVYVHIEPEGSFLAAGFYQPAVKYLYPVRQAIADDSARFEAMLDTMEARNLPVGPGGDTLTGMPRGFAEYRDTPIADYLQWKNYLVRRDVPDEALRRPDFTDAVVEMAHASLPLLKFVWATESQSMQVRAQDVECTAADHVGALGVDRSCQLLQGIRRSDRTQRRERHQTLSLIRTMLVEFEQTWNAPFKVEDRLPRRCLELCIVDDELHRALLSIRVWGAEQVRYLLLEMLDPVRWLLRKRIRRLGLGGRCRPSHKSESKDSDEATYESTHAVFPINA